MSIRYLPVCCFVLLLTLQGMESVPRLAHLQPNEQLDRQLVEFIPFICEHQDNFPVRFIRKVCSTNIQLHRRQQEQQQQQQEHREKRVGWTISV
jgi:hypothetical protein